MQNTRKRVALYARVSTKDGRQTTDNQLLQMREHATAQGWTIAGEYVDEESGRKGRAHRKQFDRMFVDAAAGAFDVVLVWAIDRFTRQGYRAAREAIWMLNDYGISFRSLTQPVINTDTPIVAELMITLLATIAEDEAEKISQRTRAGLERARRQGKTLGRPDRIDEFREKLLLYRKTKVSKREAARRLGLSVQTVRAYYNRIDETGAKQAA